MKYYPRLYDSDKDNHQHWLKNKRAVIFVPVNAGERMITTSRVLCSALGQPNQSSMSKLKMQMKISLASF